MQKSKLTNFTSLLAVMSVVAMLAGKCPGNKKELKKVKEDKEKAEKAKKDAEAKAKKAEDEKKGIQTKLTAAEDHLKKANEKLTSLGATTVGGGVSPQQANQQAGDAAKKAAHKAAVKAAMSNVGTFLSGYTSANIQSKYLQQAIADGVTGNSGSQKPLEKLLYTFNAAKKIEDLKPSIKGTFRDYVKLVIRKANKGAGHFNTSHVTVLLREGLKFVETLEKILEDSASYSRAKVDAAIKAFETNPGKGFQDIVFKKNSTTNQIEWAANGSYNSNHYLPCVKILVDQAKESAKSYEDALNK